MNQKSKRAILLLISVLAIVLVMGLEKQRHVTSDAPSPESVALAIETADVTLTEADRDISEAGGEWIDLSSWSGILTIGEPGTYILSGLLKGCIEINADEDQIVHLVLKDAEIINSNGPAIRSFSKVVITLAEDSKNILSDGGKYSENQPADACVYSKGDVTINGAGELNVSGYHKHGIHSTDQIKIVSGTLNIISKSKGLFGKDKVVIQGGSVHVEAKSDGIYSAPGDRQGKGLVWISGGEIEIIAGSEGIQAATLVYADQCRLFINSVKEPVVSELGATIITESCVTE